MAAITGWARTFDGTDGVSITLASQINATKLTGAGTSKFDAAHAISGTAWAITGAGNNVTGEFGIGSSKALAWARVYGVTPASLPSSALTIAQTYGDSDTNLAVGVQWMTDGSVRIRDNISAPTGYQSPAGLIPPNTPFRIAFKSNPGGTLRCKVYVGTNQHGAITSGVADWDSGNLANTSTAATGIDTLRLGAITNLTGTIYFDSLVGDDAIEPAPAITVGPPVVNVGSDQTKDVGSGDFTITETESLVGTGTTISRRSWTQISGPPLTLNGATHNGDDGTVSSATLTVTPLATTGTCVVRCTVTDSNGQVGSDDVTLAFVVPGVALEPVGDISNAGSWVNQAGSGTNLYQAIDETNTDLTDFVATPQTPTNASLVERMTVAVPPGNTSGCSIEVVADVTTDVTSSSLVIKVYDGNGTLKKTFSAITTLVPNTPGTFSLPFSAAEIASFAHWDSGIEVELVGTAA